VVDKLIKGGPTTEHEGEDNFNVDLVHDTDNEAEMDVEFITDGSYYNLSINACSASALSPVDDDWSL
jgi:hypothetical protein